MTMNPWKIKFNCALIHIIMTWKEKTTLLVRYIQKISDNSELVISDPGSNSKFQGLETVRILKKTTKFGPKNITRIKQSWEKPIKKEERKKKATF